VPTKQLPECSPHAFHLRALEHLQGQHEAAVRIAYRQRLTSLTIPRSPPALEVDRPHVVACQHLHLRRSLDNAHSTAESASLSHSTKASEDARNRRHTWCLLTELAPQLHRQLLGSATRILIANRQDRQHHVFGRRKRAALGATAPLAQSLGPFALEPLEPLVSSLPRDSVFRA
jgi:hypothetical protein